MSLKNRLIALIEAIAVKIKAISAALIDDTAANTITDKTYSAKQIHDMLNVLKTDILGGADTANALSTIAKIKAELEADNTAAAAITVEIGKRLSNEATTYTAGEQDQFRANINALSEAEVDQKITDAGVLEDFDMAQRFNDEF
ncbi:MAG: hypothetical protein DRQ51_10595 [Gammaproteobacteria bacterium]|nr:MAG: hypothetical protein DRQ51_10595 [Gammaproteobacteria bacterium]